jgi:hypothetical protein
MLRRLTIPLLVLALASLTFAQQVTGTWTAFVNKKDADRLNFQFRKDGNRHSNMGTDFRLSDLSGLAPDVLNAGSRDVKFTLTRDAGVVSFDGHFRDGAGVGNYRFTPNGDYVKAMAALGFSGLSDEKLFEMAMIDVSISYTRELQSLGFKPDVEGLIEARIFNVDRAQVEGLKSVGYEGQSLKKLVELRVHGVTPEYIKEMRAVGFNESLDKFAEMHIFGVTPEFRQTMAQAGYPNLGAEKLVEFKIHGITPAFIQQMKFLGFTDLSASKLTELKIFNVNAQQVDELKQMGYTGLSADKLVELRVHGIGRDFIERVQKAGYKHPSIDELVEMKLFGIKKNKDLI